MCVVVGAGGTRQRGNARAALGVGRFPEFCQERLSFPHRRRTGTLGRTGRKSLAHGGALASIRSAEEQQI